MAKTLKFAQKYNKDVTLEDVKNWFVKNLGRKIQLKGYNSFVAREAFSSIGYFLPKSNLRCVRLFR